MKMTLMVSEELLASDTHRQTYTHTRGHTTLRVVYLKLVQSRKILQTKKKGKNPHKIVDRPRQLFYAQLLFVGHHKYVYTQVKVLRSPMQLRRI